MVQYKAVLENEAEELEVSCNLYELSPGPDANLELRKFEPLRYRNFALQTFLDKLLFVFDL